MKNSVSSGALPPSPTVGDVCYRSTGTVHICFTNGVWSTLGVSPALYNYTEETTPGIWIDGDPIYRKVVDFSPLGPGPSKSVPHNIIGLRQTVRFWGIAMDTTAPIQNPFIQRVGHANYGQSDIIGLTLDPVNFTFYYTAGHGAFDTAYAIVEYTRNP